MHLPDLPDGVRAATSDDVPAILRLIIELARYEEAEDQVEATERGLRNSLFGDDPVAHALVAEGPGGDVAGLALYYLTFSTWTGRPGIHLEDLFVVPDARGTGRGEALMSALARIAADNDFGRLEWDCLEWNAPSIGFYDSLGAGTVGGWLRYRVAGDRLRALAAPDDIPT